MRYLRERHYDEVGPVDSLLLHQVGDQCYSLYGLTETHFISQYTVQVVVPQRHQPFQALQLKRFYT